MIMSRPCILNIVFPINVEEVYKNISTMTLDTIVITKLEISIPFTLSYCFLAR